MQSGGDMVPVDVYRGLDSQGELVRKHCSDAEAAIESAASMDEARQLGEQICRKLAVECGSELVVNATRAFVEHCIQKRWRTNGESYRPGYFD